MNPQGTTPPPGATAPHGDDTSKSPANPNDLPALVYKANQQELVMLEITTDVLLSLLKDLKSRFAEGKASAPTDQDLVGRGRQALRLFEAVSNLLPDEQRLRVCLLEAVPLDAGGGVWRHRALEEQRRAMAEYEVKRVKVLETLAEDNSRVARVAASFLRGGAEGELPESDIARD